MACLITVDGHDGFLNFSYFAFESDIYKRDLYEETEE